MHLPNANAASGPAAKTVEKAFRWWHFVIRDRSLSTTRLYKALQQLFFF